MRVAVLLAVCLPQLHAAVSSFSNPVAYPTDPGPSKIVVADFNQDGCPDILIQSLSGLAVLRGSCDGKLAAGQKVTPPAITPFVSLGIGAFAVADFTGDGKLDLLVQGGYFGNVDNKNHYAAAVLPGKGDGTFGAMVQLVSLPDYTFLVGAADVTGDGKADAVFVSNGTFQVMAGNGNGTFQSAVGSPQPAAAGDHATFLDVNGDGKFDFASSGSYGVAMMLAASGGSLTAAASYGFGGGPAAVLVDVNHDGKADLVAISTADSKLHVMLGNSAGGFGADKSFAAGIYPDSRASSLSVADVDGDGFPDAIIGHALGPSSKIDVVAGNGDGTFQAPSLLAAVNNLVDLVVADFNQDGKPDLLYLSGSTASMMLNTTVVPLPVNVQIAANVAGLTAMVDGNPYPTPAVFSWVPGSAHSISWATPQTIASGTRAAFIDWSDSSTQNPRVVSTGSADAVYTARFKKQYLITIVNTDVRQNVLAEAQTNYTYFPDNGYWDEGIRVKVSADAYPGYVFTGFTGDLTGSTSPQYFTVDRPRTITANFAVFNPATTGFAFQPLTPCRIVDTRGSNGETGPVGPPILAGGETRTLPLAGRCGLPANAKAYSLNITVVPPGTLSYLSAWPSGTGRPLVSTLNSFDGRVVANAAIVPAGTSGSIDVFASNPTHVIVDVNGYFTAQSTQYMAFYLAPPCRVLDTRLASGPFGGPALAANTQRVYWLPDSPCSLPQTAYVYSLNATVVPAEPVGFLSLFPAAGQSPPNVSTLNSWDGSTVANAAIVPNGFNGIVAYANGATHLVLDVNGYFGPMVGVEALTFYPVQPCRIVDTRNPAGTFGGPRLTAGEKRDIPIPASACGIPVSAKAYSLNATVVPAGPLSFLTLWAAGAPRPFVSTLNSLNGRVLANAAIVPAGAGGAISAYVTDATDLLLDINGYFAP